jgi:precorrin-6B methylase 2
MTMTMSSKGMKWMWVVVCVGLVGCAPEKSEPQKATGSKASAAKPAAKAPSSTVAQQTSPGTNPAPKTPSSAATAPAAQASTAQTPPAVEEAPEPKRPDVIFVPTPPEVVDKMLELAQVTKDDVVYDLGCGDGRIVVTAAQKYGCRAYGFDVDPERIQESKENVEKSGVGNLATIEQKDIFTLDLSKASVVTLYLLPSLNVKLIPQLEKLKPGSRIVSHDFDMRGVTPDKVVTVDGDGGYGHEVYLWTTPLKKEAETK